LCLNAIHMKKIFFPFFLLLCLLGQVNAQVLTSTQVDSIVEKVRKTFDVPGIAVAIIKDDKIIHSKGYGLRSLNGTQKVDENTLFGIASNSKAFTCAALAILVDEGKITWNDKVSDHIPEFKMHDPYVSSEFTIKDLLTHRSGLGLGAGDLMFFPDSSDFTRKDIIHNLRYLKPVSGFRTKFDYDNTLYVVAGEVIARVSGMSWEEFIEMRILTPLGMNKSGATYTRLKDKSNVIDAHAPVNGKVTAIRRDFSETANAAGGIYSSIADMSKWVMMQLNHGKYGDNKAKTLFSDAQHAEMWTMQTIIPTRGGGLYNTHFAGYGLGWFLGDEKGNRQVSHTGGLAGIVTQVILVPDLKLGIIVLTNQQSGAAFTAITNSIKDGYYGVKGIDRVKMYHDRVIGGENEAKKITTAIWKDIEAQQKLSTIKPDTAIYGGVYHDVWFGDVMITLKNGKLWFDSKRSPRLSGEMLPYKANTFVVKWNDRSMDADAFAMFTLDNNGKAAGFTMKAISPLTDFSYDFHDLDLKRK
jgi:CubicO group peptidase (beta-lactamase class C family)